MTTITEWLINNGFEPYSEAFAANAVDFDVLQDLTDADLKELGLSLGDRKRFLKAVAGVRFEVSNTPSPPTPITIVERRPLTVVFFDLVGSTALSARLDPEDLREIINEYQRRVGEVVARFDGFVAKYMGDGILAYFGYPQAHEDDPEQAVRAALAVVEAVTALPSPEPLQVRVGIATGLVVVGDLIGSGSSQEQTVVGDTPNLAARLQAIAEPGTVVIAESVHELVGSMFDVVDLGPQELKGITGQARAFRVLWPAPIKWSGLNVSVLSA